MKYFDSAPANPSSEYGVSSLEFLLLNSCEGFYWKQSAD